MLSTAVLVAELDVPPIDHPIFLVCLGVGVVFGLLGFVKATPGTAPQPNAAARRWALARWAPALVVVALGTSMLLAQLAVRSWALPRWPTVSSEDRLFFVVLGLTLVSTALALAWPARPGAHRRGLVSLGVLAGAAAVACAAGIVGGRLLGSWPALKLAGAASVALAGGAAFAFGIGGLVRAGMLRSAGIVVTGVLLASVGALLTTGSISYGQYALGPASAAAGLLVAGLIRRSGVLGVGASSVALAGLIASALAGGHAFSELSWIAALVLMLAPLIGFGATFLVSARAAAARPWLRPTLAVLVAALVAAGGVAPGVIASLRALSEPEHEYSARDATVAPIVGHGHRSAYLAAISPD